MALAFGNYYKLAFRDDPVLFADLLILGEAGEMAGQYQLFLDWKLILALACILAGFLILFFLVRGRPNGRARIISAVAVLAAVLLGGRAYIGDGLYEATGTNLESLNQRPRATTRMRPQICSHSTRAPASPRTRRSTSWA